MHVTNCDKELKITGEMFVHKREVFDHLFESLGLPKCDVETIKHQAQVAKAGSNYIKVDFKGEIKFGTNSGDPNECSSETFVMEFQKGRANMDHAKALVYPLIDASCKIGIWIAEDYGEYIKKAVQNFNEKLNGVGYKFYLVTYKLVRGDITFSKVVGPEIGNAEQVNSNVENAGRQQ